MKYNNPNKGQLLFRLSQTDSASSQGFQWQYRQKNDYKSTVVTSNSVIKTFSLPQVTLRRLQVFL